MMPLQRCPTRSTKAAPSTVALVNQATFVYWISAIHIVCHHITYISHQEMVNDMNLRTNCAMNDLAFYIQQSIESHLGRK
jgi:hypothetical protein